MRLLQALWRSLDENLSHASSLRGRYARIVPASSCWKALTVLVYAPLGPGGRPHITNLHGA